jgi:predicted nucleic acid-binding protein
VLDADVVIGALDGSDAHHAQARALFTTWRRQGDSALVSVVNLSEVLVAPAADAGRLQAARRAIAALGVAIHSPTEAIGVEASRLRAHHRISLPDAYLLATTRQTAGTAVSFDRKVTAAATAEGLPRLEPPGT